jgi:hypothetical protein
LHNGTKEEMYRKLRAYNTPHKVVRRKSFRRFLIIQDIRGEIYRLETAFLLTTLPHFPPSFHYKNPMKK